MKGEAKSLDWIKDKMFEVPFFQRPYVWNEDNWGELWESIKNSKSGEMPFIGSFILQEKPGEQPVKFLVIDGQQRLTTLSILIKSYLEFAKDVVSAGKEYQGSFNRMEEFIKQDFSVSMKTVKKPRIEPSALDKEDFKQIMETELDINSIGEKSHNMLRAYKFFGEKISLLSFDEKVALGDKILTVAKFFITIELDPSDDEQKIFDSVNRLGMELRNSDIIKNNLFQRVKEIATSDIDVLDIYNENWHNVFYPNDETRAYWESEVTLGRIKVNVLDCLLKDFATIKQIYIPSETGGIEDLSKKYKEYASKLNCSQLIAFVKEIASYAKDYVSLFKENPLEMNVEFDEVEKTTLMILKACDTTTFNPYLLKIKHENPENIKDLYFNLQKFFVKRLMYSQSTKNYNKVSMQLLKEATDPFDYLENYSTSDENPTLVYSTYPSGLLSASNGLGRLIIFLVELIKRKEVGVENFSTLLQYNKFSLEHIMPQKWKTNWTDVPCYLKDETIIDNVFQRDLVRTNKIYSIGNMMLLTKQLNSKIKNAEFAIKIKGNGTPTGKGIENFVGGCITGKEIIDTYNTNAEWDERNIYEREISILKTLNSEYHLYDDVDTLSMPSVELPKAPSESIFDIAKEETFSSLTCGKLAYELFGYLLLNNKLSNDDIEQLMSVEFTRSTFKRVTYPALAHNRDDNRGNSTHIRYYSNPIIIEEKTIFISSQWFDESREDLIKYFKEKNC